MLLNKQIRPHNKETLIMFSSREKIKTLSVGTTYRTEYNQKIGMFLGVKQARDRAEEREEHVPSSYILLALSKTQIPEISNQKYIYINN